MFAIRDNIMTETIISIIKMKVLNYRLFFNILKSIILHSMNVENKVKKQLRERVKIVRFPVFW